MFDLSHLIEEALPGEGKLVQEYDDRFLEPSIWRDDYADKYTFNVLKLFCKAIKKDLAGCLLDVGCGHGRTLSLLEKKTEGLALFGIDFSNAGIDLAGSKLNKTTLIRDNFLTYCFSKKFDFIISLGVFEHFQDPLFGLQRVKPCLKDDGIFYLLVPNCIKYGWGSNEGFRRGQSTTSQVEWHLRRETWEKIIQSAGFEVLLGIKGPLEYCEFIWLLSLKPMNKPRILSRGLLSLYVRFEYLCRYVRFEYLSPKVYWLIVKLLKRVLPIKLFNLLKYAFKGK